MYGQFVGEPSRAELERFFFLDDADLRRVQVRRGDHNRVGFGVQVGTVRFLGAFLSDWASAPVGVVRYVAEQVAPAAETGELMRRYAERDKTSFEHSWEIREALGYRDFPSAEPATREFLEARAWTRPERPSQLFDQVVAVASEPEGASARGECAGPTGVRGPDGHVGASLLSVGGAGVDGTRPAAWANNA